MKQFWIRSLSVTLLVLVLFWTLNYSCGFSQGSCGFYTALLILLVLAFQFVVNLIYAMKERKRQTSVSVALMIVYQLFILLFLLILWNVLFLSAC